MLQDQESAAAASSSRNAVKAALQDYHAERALPAPSAIESDRLSNTEDDTLDSMAMLDDDLPLDEEDDMSFSFFNRARRPEAKPLTPVAKSVAIAKSRGLSAAGGRGAGTGRGRGSSAGKVAMGGAVAGQTKSAGERVPAAAGRVAMLASNPLVLDPAQNAGESSEQAVSDAAASGRARPGKQAAKDPKTTQLLTKTQALFKTFQETYNVSKLIETKPREQTFSKQRQNLSALLADLTGKDDPEAKEIGNRMFEFVSRSEGTFEVVASMKVGVLLNKIIECPTPVQLRSLRELDPSDLFRLIVNVASDISKTVTSNDEMTARKSTSLLWTLENAADNKQVSGSLLIGENDDKSMALNLQTQVISVWYDAILKPRLSLDKLKQALPSLPVPEIDFRTLSSDAQFRDTELEQTEKGYTERVQFEVQVLRNLVLDYSETSPVNDIIAKETVDRKQHLSIKLQTLVRQAACKKQWATMSHAAERAQASSGLLGDEKTGQALSIWHEIKPQVLSILAENKPGEDKLHQLATLDCASKITNCLGLVASNDSGSLSSSMVELNAELEVIRGAVTFLDDLVKKVSTSIAAESFWAEGPCFKDLTEETLKTICNWADLLKAGSPATAKLAFASARLWALRRLVARWALEL